MNEFFKRILGQIRTVWGKWKPIQKVIFVAIVGAAILGLILLIVFSAAPSMVPLLSQPITDQQALDRISARLDEEGVTYTVTGDNRILVPDERTARQMRAVLFREDLVPPDTDPWEIFDVERWTQTEFERNVNLRRAITAQLEQHITALEDVDSASVNLVLPERELFAEDQNPVTASVIITPKPGSDIRENRNKIEGIQRLIQFAVEGLTADNITITDLSGRVLNDFEGLEDFDRIELTRRELRVKQEQEEKLKADIYRALAEVYTEERVEIVNIDVRIDMGRRTEETTEYFPITIVPDNPRTPFDETQVIENVERSTRSFAEQFTGTGFNPEGPPGQEGQTPPAYQDLDNLVGEYTRTEDQTNYEVNERNIYEEKRPQIDRIAVSIVLDGVWRREYNDNGNLVINPDGSISREYTPVDPQELDTARRLVQGAIGYNQQRGDIVTVEHLQFDRSAQFLKEDEEYRRRQQIQMIVLYALIGLAVLLVSFIVFRLISREIERRRRLREEELSRRHQAMREAALRSAEEESTEVEMSVEERARLELQENAINMAREHPEDVAQLIRTWLMEE